MSAKVTNRLTAKALYSSNVYFQDGTALTAVLVAFLYLLLAISLDAAGYVRNLSVLAPVSLGAFALGFLMSLSRFDGFFALLHSMFVGLAWIIFLMSRSVTKVEIAPILSNGFPETQASAYFLWDRLFTWFEDLFTTGASADNYVFIFEMCFLVWWLTYLGAWSIFRYGYVWRAVIPAGAVLLINALYAPDSILAFLVIFLFVGLILLVRTNLSEQQLRWREERTQFSQDIALDFLRNGLVYSVIVLGLALLIPGLNRNPQVRSVLAPINQQWEDTTARVNRLYQGLNRQTSPAVSTFGNSLTLSGARSVTDDLVFHVQTPEGRYWRAVVYDTFTGETWLSSASDEMTFDAGNFVPAAPYAMRQAITQTITLDSPTGYTLFGAPDILRVDVPMNATVRPVQRAAVTGVAAPESTTAEGDLPDSVEITSARSRRMIEPGDSYTVISLKTDVTVEALRNASTAYPQSILELYLQLPDNFSDRVARDAQDITAQEDTAYDKARALELYLRGFEYNDAIDPPPDGRDPVEYFLYDIEQGYCDYYATSMALMLRSLGIPARVVSGYAEGYYNEETYAYQVTARDAHTWVEVFFPEFGWIEFEPTAGESLLNRPQGLDEAYNPFADSADAALPSTGPGQLSEEEMLDQMLDPNAFGEEFDLGSSTPSLADRVWWIAGLLVSLLMAIGLGFLWRFRYAGPTAFDPNLPPILYDRLQRWAARLGLQPATSNTPYENARQLGGRVPAGREPIYAITDTYVHYSFSGQPLTNEGVHAQSAWTKLRPVLWRAWLNKILKRKTNKSDTQYKLVAEERKPRPRRNL